MSVGDIFEYKSDWVETFNSILKNEIREEIDNQNLIKANIIESNQTIEDFVKRYDYIEHIPSKEPNFHNIHIKQSTEDYYFYIDNENPRFWVIHNIEKQVKISRLMKDLTSNSFQQDKIYLSNKAMENHQKTYDANSLGLTLNFEQKFTSDPKNPVFVNKIQDFDDIAYTLQIWPKQPNSINFFLEKFREIKCPINYQSLNYVFVDQESNDVLIKEDMHSDGSFTIHRGKEFIQHLNFVDNVKEIYSKTMIEVEAHRYDWDNMKGELFTFSLDKEVDPKNFIHAINQTKEFKINAFFMYRENKDLFFNCIDTHTGDKFYLQINPHEIHIHLEKNSCGNIIFRLSQNLQRFFSVSSKLSIDENDLEI